MKRFLNVILAVAIVFSLSSCAIHSGLTANLNNSTTNVILQTNNYKIIQKITGTASGTRILCLFGGYQRPLVEKARSEMLASANLIGKPRAIINETVEVNNKFFLLIGFKTVTVSAYVIEFTDAADIVDADVIKREIEKRDNVDAEIIKEDITKENTAKESIVKEDIEKIVGKWISKNGDFEITINGSVGVFSQINSGRWLRLLNKGKISIGNPKFKGITKTGELTWNCKELQQDISFNWVYSSLTLNKTGNILKVASYGNVYTLSKVEE